MNDLFAPMAVSGSDIRSLQYIHQMATGEEGPELMVVTTPLEKVASLHPIPSSMLEDAPAMTAYSERIAQLHAASLEAYGLGKVLEAAGRSKARPFHNVMTEIGRVIELSTREAKEYPDTVVVTPHTAVALTKRYGITPGRDPWGLRLQTSTLLEPGQVLVGNFAQAASLASHTAQLEASNAHADHFIRDLVALRMESRVALLMYQPESFQLRQTRAWPERLAAFRRRLRARVLRPWYRLKWRLKYGKADA